MKKYWILTKKEVEFIRDWLDIVDGKIDLIDFYAKWGTKKDGKGLYDDYQAVKRGEMSVEEFREKWVNKGDWKDYVRVMRHRIERKRKNMKKIIKAINEELKLLKQFSELSEMP